MKAAGSSLSTSTIMSAGTFARRAAALQRRAGEVGRGPVPITLFGAQADQVAIEAYEAVGITRCLFVVPEAGKERILPTLDKLTAVLHESGG